MLKARFHLGKDSNTDGTSRFMNWRIEDTITKEVTFYPQTTCFEFKGAYLRNRQSGANKIFNGAHKEIVAWIECKEARVKDCDDLATKVSYNPRISPHWMHMGQIVDKTHHPRLITKGSSVLKPIDQGL